MTDAQIESLIFDDQSGEEPDAHLYRTDVTITEGLAGLEAITQAEVDQYHKQGYLVVHGAFSRDEVDAALAGMVDLIAGKNPDFKGVSFEAKARPYLAQLSPEQKQDYVRKIMSFVEYDPRLKALSNHPALLRAVEKLLGTTPALFQDMGLIKPPRIGREKPWHQDFAYFNLPLGTPVVGTWIALDEAQIENGCMHVIPCTHRDGPVIHFQRRDWQMCDTSVNTAQIAAIPLQPGDLLFFDALLHHGTPPSHSDKRRRAVQYHYKPADVVFLENDAARLETFGEEGKDVEC